MSEKCIIPECDSKSLSRGWCSQHYGRWWRHGNPLVLKHTHYHGNACKLDDCDSKATSRGWCNKHYACWRRNGDPTFRQYFSNIGKMCKVNKCKNGAYTALFCKSHYDVMYAYDIDPSDPFTCYICGKYWDTWPLDRSVSVDHVLPKSRGGQNTAENRRPVCYQCNARKFDATVEELIVWCEVVLNHLR